MQAEEEQKMAEEALRKDREAAAAQDQERRHLVDARNDVDALLRLRNRLVLFGASKEKPVSCRRMAMKKMVKESLPSGERRCPPRNPSEKRPRPPRIPSEEEQRRPPLSPLEGERQHQLRIPLEGQRRPPRAPSGRGSPALTSNPFRRKLLHDAVVRRRGR
mmetsp:Transcript_4219/g.8155  ORF Transcript_4219/g.8155 Transcript_4219/m.8155 type:complete len:161 (-) Transcript_4219:522-1004(-)